MHIKPLIIEGLFFPFLQAWYFALQLNREKEERNPKEAMAWHLCCKKFLTTEHGG